MPANDENEAYIKVNIIIQYGKRIKYWSESKKSNYHSYKKVEKKITKFNNKFNYKLIKYSNTY